MIDPEVVRNSGLISTLRITGRAIMPDYKEMYLTMIRASEKVINTLAEAQRECEEMVLSAGEPELIVLKRPKRDPEK